MWETLSTVPHCQLYGNPWLALMHLGGSAGVWLSYVLIPTAIAIVWFKRGFGFGFLTLLFASFIFFCGFGHLLYIGSAMYGWYWLEGINMVSTAAVSLFTAFYAFKLIPTMLKIPTPDEHQRLLEHLERAVPDEWVEYYKERARAGK